MPDFGKQYFKIKTKTKKPSNTNNTTYTHNVWSAEVLFGFLCFLFGLVVEHSKGTLFLLQNLNVP